MQYQSKMKKLTEGTSVDLTVANTAYSWHTWSSQLRLKNTLTASLQRGCPGYDAKQSDAEASVILELGRCRVSLHCYHSQLHFGPEC